MVVDYLELAIKEAWKEQFLTYPNPAVGCVVVKNGNILSVQAHKKAGEAHAEVLALKESFLSFYPNSNLKNIYSSLEIHKFLIENHNNIFKECELFVTLEPCNSFGKTPACADLISILKPKKVIIGWLDNGNSGGVESLKSVNIEVEVLNDKRCYQLLEPFLKWQNGKFIFFKMAMSLNGVVTGGYISHQNSLEWVHKVRNKIDLLVIGGNTVRIDKPTLDSRMVNGKAPDILIYSHEKEFDKNIPLFTVPNRKVYISNSLEILDNYNFIMIEGGEKLYNELKNIVDLKLFIVSDKFIDRDNFKIDEELKIIYKEQKKDNFIFCK